jgi:hypothetical protein
LSNWPALTTFLDVGAVPIDNNPTENAIRPLAVGRKNWLFVGSRLAGERAAVLMSLIESAKLNGHDPWAYLKDVFERLPTLKNRDLAPTTAAAQLAPSQRHRRTRPRRRNRVAPLSTPLATAQGWGSRDAY